MIGIFSISPAYAQVDPGFVEGGTTQIQASEFLAQTIAQQSQICSVVNFEGGADSTSIGTIPTAVSDVTFSNNGLYAVSFAEAGGSWANNNNPSGVTAMIPTFESGTVTLTLSNPVSEISFWHATFEVNAVARVLGAGDVLLGTIPLVFQPGNIFGDFSFWSKVSHAEANSIITKIEFDGSFAAGRSFMDDLFVCQNVESAVGGEFIGIETTSVLAAGAQYTAAWMIPVIVSGIGIAIVIARKF